MNRKSITLFLSTVALASGAFAQAGRGWEGTSQYAEPQYATGRPAQRQRAATRYAATKDRQAQSAGRNSNGSGAEWDWCGATPENRDSQWRLQLGMIASISGSVDETFRAFYAATGQDYKQALAESYDLKDFNVKAPYYTLGFHYERDWKWWAFKWDMMFFDIEADAVARRDYYIGVGKDISYHGRHYDHLMIPRGDNFSADVAGCMSDLLFSFTPVTFFYGGDDSMRLTPSVDIGLVLFGAQYKIDDGAPRGSTVYQNPPVDFVIGGKSSSIIGGGAPKIGLGGTFTSGRDGERQWITHADIGYFSYSGSTKPFTSSSHRAKDLDLSMFSINAETGFSFPLSNGMALTTGLRLQFLDISGEIKSKAKETSRVIADRERFDKSVDFTMVTTIFYVGLAY